MYPYEFTLQFLQDNEWIRVTAVYRNIEDASRHGSDLLTGGHIARMLVRLANREHSGTWYTIKLNYDNMITLGNETQCPR